MKYINTYRLFESNEDVDINQVLFDLRIIHNDSVPGFALNRIYKINDELIYKIVEDGLIKDISDIDLSSITDEEKLGLIELHKQVLNEFDLSLLPNFDDIIDSLESIRDVAIENGIFVGDVVSFNFNFKTNVCSIEVYPFQKVGKYLSFDMDIYKKISDEVSYLCGRLSGTYNISNFVYPQQSNVVIDIKVENKNRPNTTQPDTLKTLRKMR